MSLVVSRKEGDIIYFVSDTKLQYPANVLSGTVSPMNINTGKRVHGTIKTVIINKSTCISFAGAVDLAHQTLQQIPEQIGLTELIEILTSNSQSNEVEFLIGSLNPTRLFKIKAGVCLEEAQSSWIGCSKAFARFQGYFLGDLRPIIAGSSSVIIQPAIPGTKNFFNISSTFDDVILDPEVDSVGGFKVLVASVDGAFRYIGYNKGYGGSKMIDFSKMEPGIPYPLNTFNVAEGSYNIHFFHSLNNFRVLAVHIQEGPFGIVYWREKGGLFIPHPVKMDEERFIRLTTSNFGVSPGNDTQIKSKSLDLLFEGDRHFQKQNYEEAIQRFDKVIFSSDDSNERRGLAFYKKAMALEKLGKKKEAHIELSKAIKESPRLNQYAKEFFQRLLE